MEFIPTQSTKLNQEGQNFLKGSETMELLGLKRNTFYKLISEYEKKLGQLHNLYDSLETTNYKFKNKANFI